VQFKLQDGSVRRGIVAQVHAGATAFTIESEGQTFAEWPAKSVKKHEKKTKDALTKPEKVTKFGLKKAAKTKKVPAFQARAPDSPPLPESSGRCPEPSQLQAALPGLPRRPRLVVVVDTNEIINAGPRISRAHFLQDCEAVDILLPRQVVDELDGLKSRPDTDVATCARRANAMLSDAASQGESWLLYEQQPVATAAKHKALQPDERVLRCVLDYKTFPRQNKLFLEDRIILATSDRNLQLRAMMAGVEAKPLEQIRAEAVARDRCWRLAYSNILPTQAVDSGTWGILKNDAGAY